MRKQEIKLHTNYNYNNINKIVQVHKGTESKDSKIKERFLFLGRNRGDLKKFFCVSFSPSFIYFIAFIINRYNNM